MGYGPEYVEKLFGDHKAKIEGPGAPERHAELRRKWVEFVSDLDDILMNSRHKAIMMTELENASMWSHKALAETIFEEEED